MGSNICVGCFGRPVQFVPRILEVWREKIKRKHGKECSFVIRNGDSKGNQTQIPSWQLYIGSSIVQWAGTQESNFCVFADCVAPGFYGNTWPTQLGWIFNKHEFMLWSRILWVHDHAKTDQSWKWFTPVLFFRDQFAWILPFWTIQRFQELTWLAHFYLHCLSRGDGLSMF